MKAVQFNRFGGPEVLTYVQNAPIPQPEKNQVQVRVVCAGMNPVDWKIVDGRLQQRVKHQMQNGIIPGWDFCGIITKVGPDVSDYSVGDAVYGYVRKPTIANNGTYAEYLVCDIDAIASAPGNLSRAQAAAIPLSALTAVQALQGKIKPGSTVFIQSGGGGVGGYALQYAKYKGAAKIITTSSKNETYVRELGATDVIDYTKSDLFQELKKLAPEGLDVVLESTEMNVSQNMINTVKRGGDLVSILDNKPTKDIEKIKAEAGVNYSYLFVKPDGKQLKELTALFEAGVFKPLRVETYSLSEAQAAMTKLKSKHVVGKLVLIVS